MAKQQQPARQMAAVGLVSLVNTRFFRFSKPVQLALAVGALTLAMLVTLGVVVRSQTCQRFQGTTFVPYVQPDALCTRSSPNAGWLRSSLVEQSEGSFGPSSRQFHHDNYTEQWSGWMEALSSVMHNRSSIPRTLLAKVPFDTPQSVRTLGVGGQVRAGGRS
jgi:hypothetical protein